MADWKLRQAVARGIAQATTNYFFTTYVLPSGAVILTGWLGHGLGLPWFYIWLGVLGTFAFVAFGLNQFFQWRTARTPDGKLSYGDVAVGLMENKTTGEFPAHVAIKLGANIRNHGPFPIEIKLETLDSRVADRVPGLPFVAHELTVGAYGVARFSAAAIDLIGKITPGCILVGAVTIKIKYGQGADLKYELEMSRNVAIKFDENGAVIGTESSVGTFTI